MKFLLLPGDGIGVEVMFSLRRVLDWWAPRLPCSVDIEECLIGGASLDAHAVPITVDVLAKASDADVVFLGAVGGERWNDVPFHLRPEAALLKLRKVLEVFANIRPAICFPPLIDASSLKKEIIEGLNLVIVRELTGGIYFGEPRGIFPLSDGSGRRGINTHVYTTAEIRRVAEVAFLLAKQRSGKVTSVEKSNVMDAGRLWKEEVIALHKESFMDVELQHMLADNCAMQLVKRPKQFDVIVTDNFFGDLLSDEAAMLTGSLGMLPSASVGKNTTSMGVKGLYEPVHGSAPDIEGKGCANPCAAILSLSMALSLSLGLQDEGEQMKEAVIATIALGKRTPDIALDGVPPISTNDMTTSIIERLEYIRGQ